MKASLGCILSFLLFALFTRVASAQEALRHFEANIRPVLIDKCIQCHGAKKQEGNLRLDSLQAILKGGDSGSALDTLQPGESLLLEALRYESFEMPPSGQLDAETIEDFERWLKDGATWPEDGTIRPNESGFSDDDLGWWAFQPLADTVPPVIAGDTWSQNGIDQYVLEAQLSKDIQPAPKSRFWRSTTSRVL